MDWSLCLSIPQLSVCYLIEPRTSTVSFHQMYVVQSMSERGQFKVRLSSSERYHRYTRSEWRSYLIGQLQQGQDSSIE